MLNEALTPIADRIGRELSQPVADPVRAAADELCRRHGDAIAAILFYGSCLRDKEDHDRVLDFYVIVDRYRDYHGRLHWAVLNKLLPPNVYYLAMAYENRTIRAKYAVISVDHMRHATSRRALMPTLWARFSQPCALIYRRDENSADKVRSALLAAIETTAGAALPLMPERFSPRDLWRRVFQESYRTEFRAERSNRPDQLIDPYADRYRTFTETLLAAGSLPGCTALENGEIGRRPNGLRRAATRATWWLRRLTGKILHPLRLIKSAFTFQGGLDYVLWKIEKHSGIKTEPTDWQRRHPVMAAPLLAWRLRRQGAFR